MFSTGSKPYTWWDLTISEGNGSSSGGNAGRLKIATLFLPRRRQEQALHGEDAAAIDAVGSSCKGRAGGRVLPPILTEHPGKLYLWVKKGVGLREGKQGHQDLLEKNKTAEVYVEVETRGGDGIDHHQSHNLMNNLWTAMSGGAGQVQPSKPVR